MIQSSVVKHFTSVRVIVMSNVAYVNKNLKYCHSPIQRSGPEVRIMFRYIIGAGQYDNVIYSKYHDKLYHNTLFSDTGTKFLVFVLCVNV